MSKSIVFYLPEGFADWEGALLMAELRDNKHKTKIVSDNGSMVESIGGLKVSVNGSIADVTAADTRALILIGSDSWPLVDKNKKALETAQSFYQQGILVAAICAATVALGRIGMLEQKKHTSNDLGFLKHLTPNYSNEKNYVEKLAVTDGNLITASGIGSLDFTHEVLKALGIFSDTKLAQWYAMYKHGTKPPADFWA